MPDHILVFIPCYNCQGQIGRVLRQFAGPARSAVSEVLVLDNGSRDGTVEAALQTRSQLSGVPIKIARNRDNYNLGGSHKAAFAYAQEQGFDHVVTLHGDDQGNIGDLLPLLASGRHRQGDALLGSRFATGAQLINYSQFRIFGNQVFNLLFSAAVGRKITDLGSGLNLFGPRVFSDPNVFRYADDLRFNIYLLLGAIEQAMDLKFFPISWREDDQVSNVKMTSQALKTLAILKEFVLDRKRFMSSDHRTIKHPAYLFDVVD
jgi:glycosyltransferase involved in cell wall biosynthesis